MKKRDDKGQISTEYMVIIGLALAFIIPVTLAYVRYSQEGTDTVINSKIDRITDDLNMAINTVYSYGEESETTLLMKLPNGVQEISFSGKEIVFKVRFSGDRINEIVKVTGADMANCLIKNPSAGTHKIVIKKIYQQETGGELIGFVIDGNPC